MEQDVHNANPNEHAHVDGEGDLSHKATHLATEL